MAIDVLSQLLVPVGAIFAASITAAISFVSLVTSKEQATSQFRQAWIDELRSELAEFSAQARMVSREETPVNFKKLIKRMSYEDEREEDHLLSNRQRLAQTYYSIVLRLNLADSDHVVLKSGLNGVYEILNTEPEVARYEATVTELEALAVIAQKLLKGEWKRVKQGEPAYISAKLIAKRVAIALAIVFLVFVVFAIWRVLL